MPRALFSLMPRPPPSSTLFPYTTLFRSRLQLGGDQLAEHLDATAAARTGLGALLHLGHGGARVLRDRAADRALGDVVAGDRKSTRLNSSHVEISYAVFCLKKKKNMTAGK